jgi:hypothetical protein
MAAALGTGTTVLYPADGSIFSNATPPAQGKPAVLGVSWAGISRPAIKTTHTGIALSPGTFGTDTKLPGDIVQCGQITITGYHDPDITPPIEAIDAPIAINWGGDGVVWTVNAHVVSWDYNIPMEDVMGFTCVLETTGGIDIA